MNILGCVVGVLSENKIVITIVNLKKDRRLKSICKTYGEMSIVGG